jgi:GcrA cell cycle regulator
MSKKEVAIKTMANIGISDCRWPIGDPRQADFHFCGVPQTPGRPYCAVHCALSFEASRPRTGAGAAPIRRAA